MDKSVDVILEPNLKMAHLKTATVGMHGIDINRPLTAKDIVTIRGRGYDFVCRYLGREKQGDQDLSLSETNAILRGELGLIAVQHVQSEKSWVPSLQLGNSYGHNTADFANDCGLPPGTMIFLDLEGVDLKTPTQIVIDYCNQWHSVVAGRGFLPGIYIGWHCGISASDLYHKLRFTHYWGAYNLNADEAPLVRGLQMKQMSVKKKDKMPGLDDYDINVIEKDNLGGLPVILTENA